MAYTISSDSVGLAIGSTAETASDVHEALRIARCMKRAWQTLQSQTKRATESTATTCWNA
jgi:hypothetical protein